MTLQGGLQRRVQRQDSLPEVAAVSPRPALSQHIALAIQRQASVLPVIVGAPLHRLGADGRLFLAGQFSAHSSARAIRSATVTAFRK